MARIVVTGGRNYTDWKTVYKVLSNFHTLELFVGDAMGLDYLARRFYYEKATIPNIFDADWDKHGKAAGSIRNREMLEAAGKHALVIAFPGRGTANCIKTAKELGMTVLRVEE